MSMATGKVLGALVDGLPQDLRQLRVTQLASDSRAVERGGLFLAYPGREHDGRHYISNAVAAGAAAVLAEPGGPALAPGVPVIEVPGLAARVSDIAGRFYDHPSRHLRVVGVTGTNGKTSCAHITAQLLRELGGQCGLMGTLGSGLDAQWSTGSLTTPDAITIQRTLASWHEQQAHYAVMEVSSHGLHQGRVDGLQFTGAVFTNLSRDHLDYHGDMTSYAEAKALLFRRGELQFAVINGDDAFGRRLLAELAPALRRYCYSLDDSSADLYCSERAYHGGGTDALVATPWGEARLRSQLLGPFNLSNLLAAVAVVAELGFPLSDIVRAVDRVRPVPGRMERLPNDSGIDVIVDYAHTPDALTQALTALRAHTEGELWCVFGCGGDRDRGKRPQMGAIAEQLADEVVVTSDNPRGEVPADIIEDIVAGMEELPHVELSRETAIGYAIAEAEPGDVILIAGKGHEDYQLIGDQRLPFSDSDCARRALARRRGL